MEMTEQIKEQCGIRVSTNIKGAPLSFTRNDHREKVTAIYEHWRVANEAQSNQPGRDYFRIKTSKGLVCDIYSDMMANRWYLNRIHYQQ